jgi:HK97 family phage portal protein
MSLFRVSSVWGPTPEEMVRRQPSPSSGGAVAVTNDTALRHSAVWAALRLRGNLVSTLPVDAFRKIGDISVQIPRPAILILPGGESVDIMEWLYSSQVDLDRAGNVFGLITARNGLGLPSRIELQALSDVIVRVRNGRLDEYRFAGKKVDPADVWHEKQYTVAGLHVGLSPVAYAAWTIGEYLSITQFALEWFGGGGIPVAMLRNKAKSLTTKQIEVVKGRFKESVANRDLFVTGADWEYDMIQAEQAGNAWIEAKSAGLPDIARYFDVPADLIDAAVSGGSSITYANIIQRNLQLLIMHLNPALRRREAALSRLLPAPRYVQFNRNGLLQMDPATRAEVLAKRIEARTLAPSEARAIEDLPPFTSDQLAEFDRLFGPPKTLLAPAVPTPGG